MIAQLKRAAPAMGNGSYKTVLLGGSDEINNSINTPLFLTKPPTCKRFNSCNAPQCPLDEQSLKAPYVNGERICPWLYEFVKGNYSELEVTIGSRLTLLVGEAYFKLFDRYKTIAKRLERSKHTTSRLSNKV